MSRTTRHTDLIALSAPGAGLRPARPPRGTRKLGAARRFLQSGLAGFAGLARAAVAAPSGATPPEVPQQTPQQAQVTANPLAPLSRGALRELPGRFRLADGRKLEVAQRGRHLMVAVGRQWALPLEHLGGHRFATRDGRLAVEFLPATDGRVDALRLSEPRRLTLASSLGRP